MMGPPVPEKPVPPRVAKETIGVVVRTADLLIVGQIHVQPNKRLKDELNLTSERFIALTEARVYDAAGTRLSHEAGFVLVANAHIVSMTPLDAISGPPDAVWLPRGR